MIVVHEVGVVLVCLSVEESVVALEATSQRPASA